MASDKKPSKSWEAGAFDREKGEWVHTELHSWEHAVDVSPEMFVRQGTPVRITSSRRRQPDGEWDETVAGVGDIHFPFQDKRRLALGELALRITMPDTIVLLGDNLDNAMFSRFETRAEWVGSTQRGIDEYTEFLARLRAEHPEARIVWEEGNHDIRLEKAIRQYNGELLGIRRAGEALGALTLEFLTRCGEFGVEFNPGYPTARTSHRGLLETFHGRVTTSSGLAASKVIRDAVTSFMTGHTHQLGVVSKTLMFQGEQSTIYGAEAGTYADINQIPSGQFAPGQKQWQNWQTGLVLWGLSDEHQLAVPDIYPIDQHGVQVHGKVYKS